MPESPSQKCKNGNIVDKNPNKSTKIPTSQQKSQVNKIPPRKSTKIIYRITRETHSEYVTVLKVFNVIFLTSLFVIQVMQTP